MPPERTGPRKIIKLRLSPRHLAQFVDRPSAATTSQKATEKPPKKDKKPKKSTSAAAAAAAVDTKEPLPQKEIIQLAPKPKESKKSKKQQVAATPAAGGPETPIASSITLATPKPAGSGIKIKFNVNTLKNAAKENAAAAAPQTPSTPKAAAALTAQTITPAPITAPTTSSRPAGLSNLPPLQTKVGNQSPAVGTASTPSVPKIRLKASFSGLKSANAADTPKAQTPKTPIIKLKSNASRPTTTRRAVPIGYGYDSEAEDREEDPAIEEQFILRMPPGEDCEYLRSEIEKKEFGKSSDVWFKFKDDRRAIVGVRGRIYSATLVDLPCIIESNKTIDKGKNIFKTADISQMLLVGDRLIFEDQTLSNAIPNSLVNYPHGITPPMHWARRRRFRKRAVNRNMDKVEEAVEKLLAADAECESVDYELLTEADLTREADEKAGRNMMNYEMGEEDADGEIDMTYEEDGEGEEDEGDEHALDLMDFEGELTAMMDDTEHAQPEIKHAPAPISSDEDEDDDDDEEEEDNDGDAMDLDPGMSAEKLQLKEEMADLERAITVKTRERDGMHNQIVRQRIQNVIDGLKAELELKKSSLEGTA
ncbi:uncharacterized protein DFL_007086 [Arthrobotrys flagrans]|uniref:TAFII55 protein conserved region domain-containing protein n=1 Tax=Arthrobotrys flagrans TaxID=97331 RepID=A0A436ZUP7_ARTFL|nr:hypothetical protein DFL_007086 [Arthrobotrys flagrans]